MSSVRFSVRLAVLEMPPWAVLIRHCLYSWAGKREMIWRECYVSVIVIIL